MWLEKSVDALTGGQVKLPTVQIPDGPVGKLPPEVYANLVGWHGMIMAAEKSGIRDAGAYDIDVEAAAKGDEALMEAMKTIAKAGQDPKFIASMRRKKDSAPVEGKKEAKAPEPDPADMLGEDLAKRK
jgi:hypothetical protein